MSWSQPGLGRRVAVAGVALIATCGCVSSARASLFNHNLVVDPGAESAAGSADGSTIVLIPGWTTTGSFTVGQWGGGPEMPGVAVPGPADRAVRLFTGGPTLPVCTAAQEIDLTTLASAIDAGAVHFRVGGWLGGFGSQDDVMLLSTTFKNSSGGSIGASTLQGPSAALRQNTTQLMERSVSGALPAGTRRVAILLVAQRSGTGYNNAYADSISFVITRTCTADFDDGTGSGIPDGGVTIDDLLYYLTIFDAGNVDADVDDGTGTGTPDGGVTIDDLLYYLIRFDLGC